MTRRAAFLRGINLGDRRVKMQRLRRHFEELGLEGVASYGASGNVVFRHPGGDPSALERAIEAHLEEALGFATATFVRSMSALRELVSIDDVESLREDGFDLHVLFLRHEAEGADRERLRDLETPDDEFRVRGREVVWLRRGGITDASFSMKDVEAALEGNESTTRNLTTLRRIVAKFGAEGGG